MANGENELEVGRKELTLDRPPSLASPTTSPKNIKKPLDDNSTKESSKCLSVSNDDLIEKLKNRDENEQILEDIVGNSSYCSNVNDHPLSSSDDDPVVASQEEGNSTEIPLENNIDENHYASESVTNSISQKPPKKVHYFHGKQLVSCLKTSKHQKNEIQESDNNDENNSKRNVHFPQEDNYVKEFIDPVDPWRDVRTPSKGEVVSFYRNSCHKQRTKPIEKVVKQIQDLTDLSQRNNTLILRGSRLDNRSCEALESVFRRVQFENLDLENCSLEEDGATAILEMIEFYHSTCKLNIACNPKIGMRGWQALCRMLRKTPCLTYLDARRTLLTDMTMPTFGRCLKADPPLKILHLEGVFLSGRPMLILTTAMKYNKILEELYLGDNDLSSSDGSPVGAMLTYNTTLQLLDLRNNQIKDVGLAHICNGLSDQAEQNYGGLCSLILWNNGLTHEGMSYLSEGLVHTGSLKALNLGHNRIGDLGIQKLKIGLIKNKSLHKLGFLNTKLGSEGAVALAEVLADSLSITRIDIRENNIQTAGLMAFSMALKVNESLLRLDLDKDIRKEPGMEQVMQTVLVDIYNYCHRNKQIARQSLQSSASTISDSMSIVRQASNDSEFNDCHIINDDVFHPEDGKQAVMPFSPVYTDQNQVALKFPLSFDPKTKENQKQEVSQQQAPNPEPQISQPATQKELISAISSSPHAIPKDPGVHILNKPPLNSSERRGSNRFSVTKILDSLGSHAAGVANKIAHATNMDNKTKKQTPKDDISKAVEASDKQIGKATQLPMKESSNNAATQPTSSVNKDSIYTIDTSQLQGDGDDDSVDPPPDGSLNSPIEIINVDDPDISRSLGLSNDASIESYEKIQSDLHIKQVLDSTKCQDEPDGEHDVIMTNKNELNKNVALSENIGDSGLNESDKICSKDQQEITTADAVVGEPISEKSGDVLEEQLIKNDKDLEGIEDSTATGDEGVDNEDKIIDSLKNITDISDPCLKEIEKDTTFKQHKNSIGDDIGLTESDVEITTSEKDETKHVPIELLSEGCVSQAMGNEDIHNKIMTTNQPIVVDLPS